MKIHTFIGDNRIDVNVGAGGNSVLWLALLAAMKHAEMFVPFQFKLPVEVKKMDRTVLKHRQCIRDCLYDSEEVRITLSDWTFRSSSDPAVSDTTPEWGKEAFGPTGHLCDLEILWQTEAGTSGGIPSHVQGVVSIDPKTQTLFRTAESEVKFDIPLQPVDMGDGTYRWVARLKTAPGTARFLFVTSEGSSFTSRYIPIEDGLNQLRIESDLPWPSEVTENRSSTEEYSLQFLSDWRKLQIPDGLVLQLPWLKRLLNRHFAQLSVAFALLSVFVRPLTVHEVIYLLKIEEPTEADKLAHAYGNREVPRAGMLQICLNLFCDRNSEISGSELVSVIDSEFGKLFEGESRVFRNKALINSETFVDTVRKLRAFYDKNKNECFEHFGLELPPVVNFMTFLETAVSSLGVEQLLAHA